MTNELQVRIVRALRFSGDPRWNYQALIYPYNTLYYVTGGDGHIRVNGFVTDMKAGFSSAIFAVFAFTLSRFSVFLLGNTSKDRLTWSFAKSSVNFMVF